MRLKINFNLGFKTTFDNQVIVNSWLHKLLGTNNKYHDLVNNFSVSMLSGGKRDGDMLSYDNNAFIIISSNDMDFIDMIMCGVLKPTDSILQVKSVDVLNDKLYDGYNMFHTLSPILLKNNGVHITVNDLNFKDEFLKHIKSVASKVFDNDVVSSIDLSIYKEGQKTKSIKVKNVYNKSSHFSFTLKSTKDIADYFYNSGFGHSRGSGFGTVYHTEFKNNYVW